MINLLPNSIVPGRAVGVAVTPNSVIAWPWFTAILFVLVFIMASHDFAAARNWQIATESDVANLAERVSEGRIGRQLAFPILAIWALVQFIKPARTRFHVDGWLLVPAILMVVWAFGSILWSHDRPLTFKRLIVLGSMLLAVVAFARQYRLRDVPFCMLVGTSIMMLLGIACELIYSPALLGDGYRFAGSQHPNHTGINSMLMMLASIYFFARTGLWRFIVLAAIGFVILILTKSRTAMLGGVVGVGVFLVLTSKPQRSLFVGALFASIALLFTAIYTTGILPPVYQAVLMGRENSDPTTLTGRTDIWSAGFQLLMLDPTRLITGMGFDSFWNAAFTDHISKVVKFKISESHNAYIDLIFELGIVGLVLWVTVLGMAIRANLLRLCINGPGGRLAGAFGLAMLAFVIVHGIAEATFIDCTYPTLFSFILIGLAALQQPASISHPAPVVEGD